MTEPLHIGRLDPDIALLAVDLQKGVIGSPVIHPIAEVVERTRALIDTFRARRLPIALMIIMSPVALPAAPNSPARPRSPF